MPDLDLIRRGDAKAAVFPLWEEATGTPVCEIAEALDAIPAAEGEGKPQKPPMLLARVANTDYGFLWFVRLRDQWSQVIRSGSVNFYMESTDLEVDRTASDPGALKLYDADLAASREW